MRLESNNTLTQVDYIKLDMPVDNLSVDANGHIWAAGLPKPLRSIGTSREPFERWAPVTAWRIEKVVDEEGRVGWRIVKVLEDREGGIFRQMSTVVHDVKTGRLFVGGELLPPVLFLSLSR